MKFEYVNVQDREKMVQGAGKFVRYREKFEKETFQTEKGYAVFLGEILRDRTFCSRQRDIRDRG